MIRLTSFPILVLIALYERQTYRRDSLMEQLEALSDKYLGGVPKLIRNAGEFCTSSNRRRLLTSPEFPAGLESFAGASHDVAIVFEVEKEIGDYYQGWDDDNAFSDLGEPMEPDASDIFDDKVRITAGPAGNERAPPEEPEIVASPDAITETHSAAPPPTPPIDMTNRPRRGSMPSTPGIPFPLGQPSPRKRRQSVVEPSPLARLFLQDNLGRRAPRVSFTGGSVPPRMHVRKESLQLPGVTLASHPIETIQEGRTVTFSIDSDKPPSSARRSSIQGATSPESDEPVTVDVSKRLQAIETRQQRIEELLEALVKGKERRQSEPVFDDL